MIYTVMIVEDEPGAVEYLKDIFEMQFPQFQVIACGADGEQGLQLAERHRPDLIFTDIRMPKMDGLELIKALHKKLPDISTVIVSGYQDFEYAKTALQHGAADYLLKPVSPSNMRAALERITPIVSLKKCQCRMDLIRRMVKGERPEKDDLRRVFPKELYLAAITRKNGLPSRFILGSSTELFSNSDDIMELYGRDEMECLYICQADAVTPNQLMEQTGKTYRNTGGYVTTVLWNEAFSIEKIPDVIRQLYHALDSRLIIGHSQTAAIGGDGFEKPGPDILLDPSSLQNLERAIYEKNKEQIERHLHTLLLQWRKAGYPQLRVENAIRAFLMKFETESRPDYYKSIDFMIDDTFYYATCYDDLKESLLDIIDKLLLKPVHTVAVKIDSPEFFSLILNYIDTHFSEPISLPEVCRVFNVSQTSVSKMFRKYSKRSFNSYITYKRIEKAKSLLHKNDLLIKDVAAMVGIADPFYFSTIFRSITGQTPSDYILFLTDAQSDSKLS